MVENYVFKLSNDVNTIIISWIFLKLQWEKNEKLHFFLSTFSDIKRLNILCMCLKSYLHVIMEGDMSQFFYLGPSFYSIECR